LYPFTAASSEINSEPHTGARPSVRLCVGPELSRCVHKSSPVDRGLSGSANSNLKIKLQ
jgi:hypothetical protein